MSSFWGQSKTPRHYHVTLVSKQVECFSVPLSKLKGSLDKDMWTKPQRCYPLLACLAICHGGALIQSTVYERIFRPSIGIFIYTHGIHFVESKWPEYTNKTDPDTDAFFSTKYSIHRLIGLKVERWGLRYIHQWFNVFWHGANGTPHCTERYNSSHHDTAVVKPSIKPLTISPPLAKKRYVPTCCS